MKKINILQILIVVLTNVLALTNFDKNLFREEKVQTKFEISVDQMAINVSNFKIL